MQAQQSLVGICRTGIAGMNALLASAYAGQRGSPKRLRSARLLFVRENCGSKNQEAVPTCETQPSISLREFATLPAGITPRKESTLPAKKGGKTPLPF
jgi:hypothetical protein